MKLNKSAQARDRVSWVPHQRYRCQRSSDVVSDLFQMSSGAQWKLFNLVANDRDLLIVLNPIQEAFFSFINIRIFDNQKMGSTTDHQILQLFFRRDVIQFSLMVEMSEVWFVSFVEASGSHNLQLFRQFLIRIFKSPSI